MKNNPHFRKFFIENFLYESGEDQDNASGLKKKSQCE